MFNGNVSRDDEGYLKEVYMFSFLKKNDTKQKNVQKLSLKINGMHCVSCSLNIDGELEEMEGVLSASTSYAKSVCEVSYDPSRTSQKKMIATVQKLGYVVTQAV